MLFRSQNELNREGIQEEHIVNTRLRERKQKEKTPEEPKYTIDEILERKGNKYLVKWEGYKDPTWEPYKTIEEDAPKAVEKFKRKNK